MAITSVTMQMRRGNEADFDPDKMIPGEWAVSLDTKYVRMCFSPGVCIRMATYEAFELDMAKVETILEEAQTIEEAITLINTEVSDNAKAVVEYTEQAKQYRDEAKQFRDEAENIIGIDTYEELSDKPSINGVELSGNKSLEELGIQPTGEYALTEKAGYSFELSINNSTYEMTLSLLNASGTVLDTKTVDFPIESMIVDATYKDGIITMTLQNGNVLPVDVSTLVSGLVQNTFTIAGIDMTDDITAKELKTALELNNVPNVTTNDQAPTFTQATDRENIASSEKLSVILGKIMKFFADLKAVAFSGSYNDLTDAPSTKMTTENIFELDTDDIPTTTETPTIRSGLWTAKKTGVHHFYGYFSFPASSSTPTNVIFSFAVGGKQIRHSFSTLYQRITYFPITLSVYLKEGDTLSYFIQQYSGSTMTMTRNLSVDY